MEILGIGATELVFIILIAIIVLGPKDMQKAGKTIGRWLNQIRSSEGWRIVRDTSRELSNLPNKWMREANLEMWESQEGAQTTRNPHPGASAPSRRPSLSLSDEPEKTIQPPSEEKPAGDPDKHE
jgi:sec-independent protein translocase protein TatB